MAHNTIRDLMTSSPITATPDMTVAEARALMHEHEIRHLPIEGDPPGIVSEPDLALVESLARDDPKQVITVRDVMREAFAVPPTASVPDVAWHMAHTRVGSVVIVEDGVIVGIFTAIDALSALRKLVVDQDASHAPGP